MLIPKIARGKTAAAKITSTSAPIPGGVGSDHDAGQVTHEGGVSYGFQGPDYLPEGSWKVVKEATVSVPDNAPIGHYTGQFYVDTLEPNVRYTNFFEFEVVCLTLELDQTEPVWDETLEKYIVTVSANVEGGQPSYTYQFGAPGYPSTQQTIASIEFALDPGQSLTVTVTVSDSDVPPCTDSQSITLVAPGESSGGSGDGSGDGSGSGNGSGGGASGGGTPPGGGGGGGGGGNPPGGSGGGNPPTSGTTPSGTNGSGTSGLPGSGLPSGNASGNVSGGVSGVPSGTPSSGVSGGSGNPVTSGSVSGGVSGNPSDVSGANPGGSNTGSGSGSNNIEHCCPTGQFFDPRTNRCEPIPFLPPLAPNAPALASRTRTTATIAWPALPTLATGLRLYRGTTPENGVLLSSTRSENFVDAPPGPTSSYFVVAFNAHGDSPPSPLLNVSLIGQAVPGWIKPDDGANVHGKIALVVRIQSTYGLAAVNALIVNAGGQNPPMTRISGSEADSYWKGWLDTRLLDFAGAVTLTAIARDFLGFDSLPVSVAVNVDNSLWNELDWLDVPLDSVRSNEIGARNEKVTKLMAMATFERAAAGIEYSERFWKTFAVSPIGARLPNDSTAVQVLTDTRRMQPAVLSTPRLGRNIEVTGDQTQGAAAVTDETALLRFIGIPVETFSRYETPCSALPKLRERGDGLMGFGIAPAVVFEITDKAVNRVLELETRGMADATDAARLSSDKVFCLNANRVRICDLDNADRDGDFAPVSETRTPHAVEEVSSHIALIYNGVADSTLWRHDGRDFQKVWTLNEVVTATDVYNDKSSDILFFATASHQLYSWKIADSTPTLLGTHSAAITAFLLPKPPPTATAPVYGADAVASTLSFADATGGIYSLESTTANNATTTAFVALATLPGAIAALGELQGAAPIPRGVASVANVLYRDVTQGYIANRVLDTSQGDDVISIPALRGLVAILIAQSGDPLKGGQAEVLNAMLWGGTAVDPATGTAWWFRWQMAPESEQSAYRGLSPGLHPIALKPVGFAPKTTTQATTQ